MTDETGPFQTAEVLMLHLAVTVILFVIYLYYVQHVYYV